MGKAHDFSWVPASRMTGTENARLDHSMLLSVDEQALILVHSFMRGCMARVARFLDQFYQCSAGMEL